MFKYYSSICSILRVGIEYWLLKLTIQVICDQIANIRVEHICFYSHIIKKKELQQHIHTTVRYKSNQIAVENKTKKTAKKQQQQKQLICQ